VKSLSQRRKAHNGEGEPDHVPDGETGAERDGSLRAASQNPRYDGGDPRPWGGGCNEQGGGENEKAGEVHGKNH
jgi:hypothetical protein